MAEPATKPSLRDSKRDAVRTAIEDAMLDILAENDEGGLTHDRIAARVGIGRRTVYRYFPDRQALMEALWQRLTRLAGPGVGMPHDVDSLTDQLPQLFAAFDSAASAMTVCMSSGQGRAMRAAKTPERRAAYRAALAGPTAGLPEADQVKAVAAIQLLRSGHAWLEMRDQWGLDGQASADAASWAIRVLVADLEARGGRPLADGPALSLTQGQRDDEAL